MTWVVGLKFVIEGLSHREGGQSGTTYAGRSSWLSLSSMLSTTKTKVMTTSCLYHTQGIVGYKYQKTERIGKTEIYYLHSTAKFLSCPRCRSANTTLVKTGRSRDIRGVFIGFKKVLLRMFTRGNVCRQCKASLQEPIAFCAGAHVGYSKWLAHFLLALHLTMSIQDVAISPGCTGKASRTLKRSTFKKYKTISWKKTAQCSIQQRAHHKEGLSRPVHSRQLRVFGDDSVPALSVKILF